MGAQADLAIEKPLPGIVSAVDFDPIEQDHYLEALRGRTSITVAVDPGLDMGSIRLGRKAMVVVLSGQEYRRLLDLAGEQP